MNTQENNIPLLSEILDMYDEGTLDMTQLARKCYLSEKERLLKRVSWVHNDELKSHSTLRGMAKKNARDILRNSSR